MKLISLTVLLAMAGCGQDGASDSDAAALERAADESNPGAAEILRNAAENGADAQGALQATGNAQAADGNAH